MKEDKNATQLSNYFSTKRTTSMLITVNFTGLSDKMKSPICYKFPLIILMMNKET